MCLLNAKSRAKFASVNYPLPDSRIVEKSTAKIREKYFLDGFVTH
jgi:hypothetical protein